jgi:hypothetical protein
MEKGKTMNHRPHDPPPAPQQQQNNDRLGHDLYRGAEIVMIVVAIVGLWQYIVVPLWESVIVPWWNWWQKSFNTKEKLILLALAAYLSWKVFLALIQFSMSY